MADQLTDDQIFEFKEAFSLFDKDGDGYDSASHWWNQRHREEQRKTFLHLCDSSRCYIYGPGEERHFPRIVSFAKLGLLTFKIGDSNVKTDWVYVDNLVLATILASMGLLDDIPNKGGHPVAAGQPYFISDGSLINSFEFLRPLLRSLDYDLPKPGLSQA